jgi:hypothetical protein
VTSEVATLGEPLPTEAAPLEEPPAVPPVVGVSLTPEAPVDGPVMEPAGVCDAGTPVGVGLSAPPHARRDELTNSAATDQIETDLELTFLMSRSSLLASETFRVPA